MVRSLQRPDFGTWLVGRLLPSIGITLFLALLFGLGRAFVLFVPGIVGMIVGGLSGYLSGRIGKGDDLAVWPPSARFGITLGAALLYGVASAAVVAVVHAGRYGLPLDWLAGVVNGTEAELFTGFSRNSYQSVGGALKGAWWVIFVVVDVGLFAFLHLICFGVGLRPGDEEDEEEVGVEAIGESKPPYGFVSLGAFALVSVVVISALHWWPGLVSLASGETSVKVSVAELQGDWEFGDEVKVLGLGETGRRFSVSKGLGDELAGYSAERALYMIVMKPRRDGSFEGRFLLRGRGELPVRMKASEDHRRLDFVIRGMGRMGTVEERKFSARRIE